MKISQLSTTFVLSLAVHSVFGFALYRAGGAEKPYNKLRTPDDYDDPVVINGTEFIPPNPNKGVRISFL